MSLIKGCPYCDGAVHLVTADECWRCSGCPEEWSFEEEGWELPMEDLSFKEMLEASYRENYKKWKKQLTKGDITPEMAEDIIQLACVDALVYQETYDSKRDFDSWFAGIMNNSRGTVLNIERNGGMVGRSL